jgi:hypothetical protein
MDLVAVTDQRQRRANNFNVEIQTCPRCGLLRRRDVLACARHDGFGVCVSAVHGEVGARGEGDFGTVIMATTHISDSFKRYKLHPLWGMLVLPAGSPSYNPGTSYLAYCQSPDVAILVASSRGSITFGAACVSCTAQVELARPWIGGSRFVKRQSRLGALLEHQGFEEWASLKITWSGARPSGTRGAPGS